MKYSTVIVIWIALLASSCSQEFDKPVNPSIPDHNHMSVVLSVADTDQSGEGEQSRTAIIGDGSLSKIGWLESDKIALWANSDQGTTALTGETFAYYQPMQGNALFSATIPAMTAGTYTYYGAYPLPKSITGTQVTYTLPTTQDGTYNGAYDVMLATPVTGSNLTEAPSRSSKLAFHHKCHLMRIQVPTGRNKWGAKIKRLRIEFPTAVVGDLRYDVLNPDAAPILTNGSNTLLLDLKKPLDESVTNAPDGNYVWLFVKPGTISGALKFTAYSADGYQSETITTQISKSCLAGKITPITLTIAPELPVTHLDFTIALNNLGEPLNTVTFTAPAGATLRNGTSSQTLPVTGGVLSVGFYNTIDGRANGDLFKTDLLTLSYDSPNALIGEKMSVSNFTSNAHTAYSLTIPYLLYEDFSGCTDFEGDWKTGNAAGVELSGAKLPGWYAGARCYGYAGLCANLQHYNNWGGPFLSRINSCKLSALKPGKTVSLKVIFNSDWKKKASEQMELLVGRSTGTNLNDAIDNNTAIPMVNNTSASKTNTANQTLRSVIIANFTRDQMIAWKTNGTNKGVLKYEDVFLDNIKVSIAQ